MKVRHWDEAGQSWVIDGASNASNLELSNPGYLDSKGKSVTIDHGFTKVDNRVTKLEQNLAWVYMHGAKGGTGGTGGTGDITYTITVAEGATVYTSTTNAKINVTIASGTVKKAFTLTAKNLSTNSIIGTWKLYSLTRTEINLTDLNGSVDIELSAYDSSSNYTLPAYVKVVAGAISLSLQTTPPKTLYIGGVSEVAANFVVTNNILGSPASFILTANNIEVANVTGITTSIRALSYNLRDLIFNSGLFIPVTGQRFVFKAVAATILSNSTLSSNIITFDVTIADSNNLIIVTDEITEFIPTVLTYDKLTDYEQGSQLGFSYYLSYGLSKYSTFNIDYTISLMSGTSVVSILGEGTILNVVKSVTNRFVYSTVNIAPNVNNEYLKISLSGYAINDPGDVTAQYTKNVTCRIVQATKIDLYANNDIHTLLGYFSKIAGFSNTTSGTWTYPLPSNGPFIYEGTFRNKFPQGVKLTLKDVNGVSSGFLTNTDGVNSIPGIVLLGESYGYLEVANQMFPEVDINSGLSFFQSGGFNISTTFKAQASSDPTEVILSIGKYANGELVTGFEITLEQAYVKIGSADSLIIKLPQNELLTIDLDVSLKNGGWYFKMYLNGVLSAVTRVLESDIDWQFGTDLYLGCRNTAGVKSRFSNVTFYDVKLYTSSQSDFAIVQNYISAVEQASLILGAIDGNLDAGLRIKNFFNSSGDCLIWDKTANNARGAFIEGEMLYNKLLEQMSVNTPYPLVLIEETSNSSTLFEAYSRAIFAASDKSTVMGAKFPVKITYTDKTGSTIIQTPEGVSTTNGVRMGLQGTSSLSYNSKNFELYCGDADATAKRMLFQPKTDWLPENEFTLKADVMDSAHVNNVVIGKIINGAIKNSNGDPIKPLDATPPMALGNDIWGGNLEKANSIRSKIKHTSEGFPCLVFIRFAPDAQGNTKQPKFHGIYNFNLGRYAYYNLGLKILTDYTRLKPDGPTLVVDYTEASAFWNTAPDNGVFSIEINQNSSAQGAFQQDNIEIVKFMTDVIYTSRDEDSANAKVKKFYGQMANMALSQVPKYTMDDAGQTPTKLIPGEYYNLDKNAYYNFNASDNYLNWNSACAYFVIGIVFGLVDSMCKNMTLRNWGSNIWSTAFYDMDTAFGLNNAGQDAVEYYAHLHRWYNINLPDTNITSYTQQKNYISNPNYKQYYASWWNRIWEVLENLAVIDSGGVGDRTSIESIYSNLRENLFPDPEVFINENYKTYTEQTGSIVFNYDYNIKYLTIGQTYNVSTGVFTDSTDFSQLKFLHGNRVMHVKDWFKKRILFLDGIYGVTANTVNIPITIESPITSLWAANKATGSSIGTKFGAQLAATSKVLYRYSFDQTRGSFWLEENSQDCIVPIPNGETIIYIYANKYITNFGNFKMYPWTGLNNINFPLLEELDLSGLSNMPSTDFFYQGVYNPATGVGLKNIKTLILNNVKLTGDNASAYTLDLSNCNKIQKLDISYSTITKVTLPTSAVLKEYNLSGTAITNLYLSNQSFLETLLIDSCNLLTSVTIENCAKLTTLNLPKNVTSLTLRNCTTLDQIRVMYSSQNNSISELTLITVDNCPGLKTFDVTGQNNPGLKIELTGAKNLENLILADTKTLDILLPPLTVNGIANFYSLKSLNIARTNIKTLVFNDITYDYLNLSAFPNLDDINATACKQLIKVECTNNLANPINLNNDSFMDCSLLSTLIGHFNISGIQVFKGCTALKLNSELTYSSNGTNIFIPGGNVCNISINPLLNTLLSCFENCKLLSYNDFRYLMVRIGSNITSIETIFKNCSSINGDIWYDLFRNCPNISSIKEAFNGTKLKSAFYSRSVSYSPDDKQTWGILDFLPVLADAESAFENTELEWIDNNVFAPIIYNGVTTYSSIGKIDKIFRNCINLKTCVNSRATVPVEGLLNSETFFINLRNLVSTYPKDIFSGCKTVKMQVINDANGNTLLFHLLTASIGNMILTNTLHNGITLVGEIKNNVFGGITRTIVGNTNTYYLPIFTSIQYPFNVGVKDTKLEVAISQMGTMFNGIGNTLLQAVGVFVGTKCKVGDSTIIPSNIFSGCVKLNSIESFFSGLKLNNNNLSYNFPPTGMFDDCISLQITKNLFFECTDLKLKLVGEGFKNCKLSDVSYMFASSGVYGTIPYRLFFMNKNNGNGTYSLNKTITNMSGVFSNCWCLGYTKDRTINIGEILSVGSKTTWADHIISNPGNRVSFKLDTSNMQKTYNYETNLIEFDSWYLDGYGWSGAMSILDQAELNTLKSSLNTSYFQYDTQQAEVIVDQAVNERFIETHQNYMIPTDLFRYCDKTYELSNVLSNLTWFENTLITDLQTGDKHVTPGIKVEGMIGRIPVRLLESLSDSPKLTDVFSNTNFDAFVGLKWTNSTTFVRGIQYPPDLFKYNLALLDITNMFKNTSIPVGVDVNTNLFYNLGNLKIVSGVWSDCKFDKREYNAEGTLSTYSQFNYAELFKNNTRITNASGLFAVFTVGVSNKGLNFINQSLLQLCYNINNISSMFYYNSRMTGAVPLFSSATYPTLNIVNNYLGGCTKSLITNADQLETRLKPMEWV